MLENATSLQTPHPPPRRTTVRRVTTPSPSWSRWKRPALKGLRRRWLRCGARSMRLQKKIERQYHSTNPGLKLPVVVLDALLNWLLLVVVFPSRESLPLFILIHNYSLPFLFTLICLLPSSLFYYSTPLKKNSGLWFILSSCSRKQWKFCLSVVADAPLLRRCLVRGSDGHQAWRLQQEFPFKTQTIQ